MRSEPLAPPRSLPRRRVALAGALALSGLAGAPGLRAQGADRPLDRLGDKVVKLVNGFPAGAGLDPLARLLADRLRGKLAHSIIVENKTGAGGRLAIEAVKASPPDGNTLLFTPASPIIIFPHLYKKLSYNVLRDLAPVTTLMTIHLGIVVGASVPAKTLQEYLAWASKDAKNGSYGSGGLGTMPHFLGASLGRASGVAMTHVPYRGAAALWQDLLGGQIPMMVGPIGSDSVSRHASGQVRILAVAEPRRLPGLPDVPTFAELGFKALVMQEWWGIFVAAQTPPATLQALNAAIASAAQAPDIAQALERFLSAPETTSPEAMAARIQADLAMWKPIVQATGFTPED